MNFRELYKQEARKAQLMWAEPPNPAFDGDRWYDRNRNQICLEMIDNLCEGKSILAVGGREWQEDEFLIALKASTIVKTDIIGDPVHNVLEADAHSLPFAEETFDFVSCREVIEHVADDHQVLNEISRVLRHHGYLIITTPNMYNAPFERPIHLRGYTPHGFIKELQEHGFEIITKRGNAPNILSIYGLTELYRRGFTKVLGDFQDIAEKVARFEDSYYVGTQLFVLAQKVQHGNEQ